MEPLRLILPLILILALIFVVGFLVRRLSRTGFGKSPLLNILATLPVGSRERVILVEVADQWLVLGVTSSQINMLLNLPARPVPESESSVIKTDLARSWLERHLQQNHES